MSDGAFCFYCRRYTCICPEVVAEREEVMKPEYTKDERLIAARQLVRLRYPHLMDEETSNNEIRRWAEPGFDIMTDIAINIQCELNRVNAKLESQLPIGGSSPEVFLPWEEVEDEGVSFIFDAQEMQIVEGEPEAIRFIMQQLKSVLHATKPVVKVEESSEDDDE